MKKNIIFIILPCIAIVIFVALVIFSKYFTITIVKDDDKNESGYVEEDEEDDDDENDEAVSKNKKEKTDNKKDSSKSKNNKYSDVYGKWDGYVSTWESGHTPERFVFDSNGTFKWYKSSDDLDDNYFKGDLEIVNGDEALKELNMSYDSVKKVIQNSKADFDKDDIYCLKLTVNKTVKDGKEDDTSKNSNNERKFLFLNVGEKGYDAEAYNYSTNNMYFLKKK